MSVIEMDGDIFDTTAEVCTITVNCVGVMGAGLAKEAKLRYPMLFKVYKKLCDSYQLKVNKPALVRIDGRLFLLFPTKNHFSYPSELEWIDQNLQWIKDQHDEEEPKGLELRGLKSIALPPLGCGYGGLHWDDVRAMVHEHFRDHELEIHLYRPLGPPPPRLPVREWDN